jgi:hypothetical protein
VLPVVAEVDDAAGLLEEEEHAAAPRMAALARVAAAARRPAFRDIRTVLLLGVRGARDRTGPQCTEATFSKRSAWLTESSASGLTADQLAAD